MRGKVVKCNRSMRKQADLDISGKPKEVIANH
jgi:hypothetical protein